MADSVEAAELVDLREPNLDEEREKEVQTILDVLKAPSASEQARKRKLSVNPGNRRATKAKSASYEPKVSAKERVEEFREETLRAHDDGIFCEACKEVVAVKKSNLKAHISSKKHELNKEKLKKTNKREEDIAKALQKYDQEKHPKGDTSNINKGVTGEGSAGVPEERHPSESYRVLPRYF